MTVGSLFSGVGCFDLAFQRAGFEIKWQVELDKSARAVLERHFPEARRFADVRECGSHNLEPVDLVCFGWPCQDLSVAGLRAGLAGERSGLFFEAARIIAELRPRWIVAENVPGLHSSFTPITSPPSGVEVGTEWEVEEDSDFASVLATLDELGYCVAGRMLNAEFFGVAQRRNRVFLVGELGGFGGLEVLFESESLCGDSPPRREAGERVADHLTVGANQYSGFCGEPIEIVAPSLRSGCHGLNGVGKGDESSLVAASLRSRQSSPGVSMPGRGGEDDENIVVAPFDPRNVTSKANRTRVEFGDPANTLHEAGQSVVIAANNHGERSGATALSTRNSRLDGDTEVFLVSFDSKSGGDVGSAPGPLPNVPAQSRSAIAWHENKGGSFTPSDHAKALRSGASHSYQGVGVRRLTPTECERLMGLPDGFTAGFSDTVRYRMIGNGIVVNVAEWIARRIGGESMRQQ